MMFPHRFFLTLHGCLGFHILLIWNFSSLILFSLKLFLFLFLSLIIVMLIVEITLIIDLSRILFSHQSIVIFSQDPFLVLPLFFLDDRICRRLGSISIFNRRFFMAFLGIMFFHCWNGSNLDVITVNLFEIFISFFMILLN